MFNILGRIFFKENIIYLINDELQFKESYVQYK